MALIDSHAHVIPDNWIYPGVDHGSALKPYCILPLDVLAPLVIAPPILRPLGVFASAGTTADQLAPYLDRLDLVAVEFPKFRDGRGFTLARTLREKHGFKGDIRAIGHTLPDQFPALLRCGITSVLLPPDHPAEQWQQRPSSGTRPTAGGPLLQRLLAGRTTADGKT